MRDQNKTKKELINELNELRQRVDELETLGKECIESEKALRQNEERLRAQYNGFPIPTFIWKRVGENFVLIDYNDAAKTFTNGSVSDFVRKKDSEIYSDMPEIVEELSRCLIGKMTIKREMIYRFQTTGENKQLAVSYVFVPPDLVMVHTEDISKRKQIEENLRRERNLLNRITETSPIGITVVDQEGKIVFANPQAEVVLGLTKSKITQRTYNDPGWRITAYDGNPFPDEELPFRRVMVNGLPVRDARHAIEWPNGRRVLLSINAAPLFDDQGKIDGMVGTLEDITERVRMEKELRESEEKYKKLVEESLQGVVIAQGLPPHIIFANSTISEILGYSKDELVSLSPEEVKELIHPDDRTIFFQRYRDRLEGIQVQARYEIRGIRKDGIVRWAELLASRIEFQGKPAVHATFIDITERKQAEEQILVANARLKYLLSATPAVIYTSKISGDYGATFISDNVTPITGYKPQEFIENSSFWIDHIHPEDVQRVLVEVRKIFDQANYVYEYRFKRKDGTYIWMRDEMKMVRDEKGNPLEIVGYWLDISEHKRIEELLKIERDLGLALNATSGLNETLSECFDAAIRASGMDCGGIYLIDENSGDLDLVFHKGLSADFVKSVSHYSADSVNAALIMAGKPIYVQHQELEVPLNEDEYREGLRAIAVIPLHYRDKVIGCLNISSHTLYEIPDVSRTAIETIAIQIGNAINRSMAENALRKSKANLSALIENTKDWICSVDSEYKILTMNQVFKNMIYLFTKIEVQEGMSVMEFISAEHRTFWTDMHERALKGEHLFFEGHYGPEKMSVYVEISGNPIINENKEITGVSYFVRDITERKRAEETLWESQELYRSLFEGVPIGLYRTMPSGEILDVNQALVEILGYPDRESLLVVNLAEMYVDSEDYKRWEALIESEGILRDFEVQFQQYDGEVIWIRESCHVVRHDNGQALYYEGAIQDITERKQAEEGLRRSEEKYRTILESIEEGYYEVDLSGNLTFLNDSMCRIYGYPKEELIGMNDREYTDKETAKRLFQAFNEVYRTGKPSRVYEYEVIRKDKSRSYVEASVSLQKDLSAKPIGFRGIIRDITERKKAEERLRESEETARKLSRENAIMAEIGQIVSSTLNIDDVYERFAEKARELIPFDRIGVNVINPRDHTFTLSYNAGIELPGHVKGSIMPLVGNYTEVIMRTRTKMLIQVEDLKKNADRFSGFLMAYQAGIQSRMAIPLISKDEVIGALAMDSIKPNGFCEEDLRVAERVGSQIAGAIANAQLFMERQRAEEQLITSQEQLRALSAHLQSIREEERTLIAREIHDELGQDLTGLKMDLSWLIKRFPAHQEKLINKAESMLKLIDTTIQSVRRISAKLRPGVLDDLGLNAAIEWQAQDFQNRTGIQCSFNTSLLEVNLDRDRSTTIFRILQETLTNVARHASATKVNIYLGEKDANMVLIVEDNGRGMTESEILDPKSLGLLGMRERALIFGGKVEISGEIGKGTTVTLRIPLQK